MAAIATIPMTCPGCKGKLSPMPVKAEMSPRSSNSLRSVEIDLTPEDLGLWMEKTLSDHVCE